MISTHRKSVAQCLRSAVAVLMFGVLTACQPGVNIGSLGSAVTTNVVLVQTGIFQVPGNAGPQNWCVAGLYASTILRLPLGQRLARIAQIPAGTNSVAGHSLTGPGVLYSARNGTSVFDILAGALNESRTVQQAVNGCS